MRFLKVDYKVDRTPYVHPLGSRAGPIAVTLGGALPPSPQQFGSHPFQPETHQPERLPQPERPARVPPPQQPQPPPPHQPPPQQQLPPPPQQQLPPPPQQQQQQQPQPPPSLPEPELYDSLLQLHRLCGGDLMRCIEVAARVHHLPKHRVFEMFRLMLAARALSDVPESTPASSASGPPPTAPVHSRLPPPPPLPPEQPATAPPAIGARAWSLAAAPRHIARALPQSSGGRPAAAAPGLPAVFPMWQQQQQQQQQQQHLPQQQQQHLPPPQQQQQQHLPHQQLLQPQHRQLQPQIQHQHQHQHQPLQPPLPPPPPQQHRQQQQQVYTQAELLQQSAGQKGQVELWQQRAQQGTPPRQVPAHMHLQQMQMQMQMQMQPPDQGGEGRLLRDGAAAEARGAMAPRASRMATLQARQLELQQRQVPLVITPGPLSLPLITAAAFHPPAHNRGCTLTGCQVPGALAAPCPSPIAYAACTLHVHRRVHACAGADGARAARAGEDARYDGARRRRRGRGRRRQGSRGGEACIWRATAGARVARSALPRSKYSRGPDASPS